MREFEGHGSKKVENPYSRNVTIGNNSVSITHRAVKFGCSMEFSAMANRMVWPPSSSRDRKWPHITKCTHSRVVGFILEGSLVEHPRSGLLDSFCRFCLYACLSDDKLRKTSRRKFIFAHQVYLHAIRVNNNNNNNNQDNVYGAVIMT